jgi:hypothetical protein
MAAYAGLFVMHSRVSVECTVRLTAYGGAHGQEADMIANAPAPRSSSSGRGASCRRWSSPPQTSLWHGASAGFIL